MAGGISLSSEETKTKKQKIKLGQIGGNYDRIRAQAVDFIADSSDGSFPEATISNLAQSLARVGVVFGSPSPSSLTIKINDEDGIDLLEGEGTSMDATGQIVLSTPVIFIGQLTIVLTGNKTTSAGCRIVLYGV